MVEGYGKRLKQILRAHGCHKLRNGKGDHEIWINPANGNQILVDSGTRSRFTAQKSLKQAGIKERI